MSAAPAAPPPDLLRAAAALDPDRLDAFMGELLRVRAGRVAPHVGPGEAALLGRVNAGPPPDVWTRYRELVGRRQAGSLDAVEHAELVRLTDAVEEYQADRAAALAALAAVRGRTLAEVVGDLGLAPAAE